MITKYLVDTNVLSRLTQAQRVSRFFTQHCLLTTDVLYEASGFPDLVKLKSLEVPVDGEILQTLSEVMRSLDPDDKDLVDLYGYEGTADPVLIATALAAERRSVNQLWSDQWIVVTEDKAVRTTGAAHAVPIIGISDFIELLASSQ